MTSDVPLKDHWELLSIVAEGLIRNRCSSLLYPREGEGEISLPTKIDQSSKKIPFSSVMLPLSCCLCHCCLSQAKGNDLKQQPVAVLCSLSFFSMVVPVCEVLVM